MRENGAGGVSGQAKPKEASDETLLLLNRVVHAAVTSIVVTDPSQPDNPIVYHNPAFERVSGYSAREIDGRNCRFLQGPDTDQETVRQLREAIAAARPFHGVLLNYRRDGEPFWNELNVSPVHDAEGRLTHFVGVQNDVTRRTEAERERDTLLAQQKRIAETLQRALLLAPPTAEMSGLQISTQYEAAWDEAQFGGDFYDTVVLSEDRVALVVGDCSGKGIAAGQYTAEVKYALRVLLREYGHPTPALHRLNSFLMDSQRFGDRAQDALVCVAVAVVDTRTGETVVASAGMEPPLVVRGSDRRVEPIEARGMIVGMYAEAEYTAESTTLDEGDILLLVTDGVTEARGPRPQRAFFGYDGLSETALAAAIEGLPTLDAMGERIIETVKAFAAGGRPQDDMCLLIARRSASAPPADPRESAEPASAGQTITHADGDLAQFALEVTGLGYWELDTATGVLRRSARHDEIFGYGDVGGVKPPSEWSYQRFLSHVHPQDRARVDALYGRALAAGTDWGFECRIVRAGDGAERWIEARGRHFGAAAAATRIIGTVADITERKRAEAARQEEVARRARTEDSLRLALEAGRLGAWRLDLTTGELDCTPLCRSSVGLPPDAPFTYDILVGMIHPEDRPRVNAAVEAALRERTDYQVEYRILLPDGTQRWIDASGRGVYGAGEDAPPTEILGTIRDVTKRRRIIQGAREAERAAREIAEQLRLVTDAAPLLISYVGSDLRYRFVNQGYVEWFGVPKDRVVGRSVAEVIGQSAWEATRDYVAAALRGERTTYEALLPYGDGARPRHVHVDLVPDIAEGGEVRGYVAVLTDVSAARRAEASLRESESRFRRMADASPVMIWTSGTDAKCDWFNESWLTFTGRTMAQELGDGWAEGVHPEDLERCLETYLSAFQARHPFTMDYRLRRYDGEWRWVFDSGAPVFDADGTFQGYIGSCVDITGEKEARQKQRRFLRELLFGMTESRLRLCDSASDLPAELPAVHDPMYLTAPTLHLLREQVQEAARGLSFDRERIQDLETAVSEAAMNALKHSGGGIASVHADPAEGTVQVWVRDEGAGIAEHLIHRAVESGWTTGGFGQGLYLMWRTADRLYLLTGSMGTTIVIEQNRTPPPPAWLADQEMPALR